VARVISTGRLAEAERLSHDGFELGRASGQTDAAVFFAVQQFHILFDGGRLGELEEMLTAAVTRAPGYLAAQLMLAMAYFELGREAEAKAIFQPLADAAFTSVPMDYGWIRSMASCAYLSARLGDASAAQAAYDLLLPYRGQIVVAACIFGGSVVHYLGMLAAALGRFDDAEAHFRESDETHVRIGCPTWLAQTRLEWARTLLDGRPSGGEDRAAELLHLALATARELGLRGVERRAVELLGLNR
jgi:tetratricopeptide (TPR) repeat protein